MNNKAGDIQYAGEQGISQDCLEAVMRFLQFGDKIKHVRVLSSSGTHCLLLELDSNDLVAIKSGFSSGYRGEGPRKFAYVLKLLEAHDINIDEYKVSTSTIKRLDNSALTQSDIDNLKSSSPVRPQRIYDYIFEGDPKDLQGEDLWKLFPPVIPFAIIDNRIMDLAISFWENPDDKLLKAYRRLEDIVRERTGVDEHGVKLFSRAFQSKQPILVWKGLNASEQEGRGLLFAGTYMAYRNRRAHRELKADHGKQLAEFLLLNQLYLLEKESLPN